MRIQKTIILCLLSCITDPVTAQTSTRGQVEAALDSWSGRDSTRDTVLKITPDPASLLATIAGSNHESEIRRSHAIALLATFKTARSQRALHQLGDNRNPKYRCLALQSLVELESRSAAPVLIGKLDDQAVCMKIITTDPAREEDVYVSDEAVRLLEHITGQSLDQPSTAGHRATKPWKAWWAKQPKS